MDFNELYTYNYKHLKKLIKQLGELNTKSIKNYAKDVDFNVFKINISNINIDKLYSSIIETLSSTIKQFETSMGETFEKDLYEQIKEQCNVMNDKMIKNYKILGSLGWGFYYIEEISNENKLMSITLPKKLKGYLDNEETTILEVDKFITNCLKKDNTLDAIINKIEKFLEEKDIVKLEGAIDNYNAKRYHECAELLMGLIDAQSIKHELFDKKHNNCNVNSNLKQGFDAFRIIFANNFKDYFNNKFFSKNDRKNKFENFIKDTKNDMDMIVGDEILCVMFPLETLFADNTWEDYPNKPKVINRNWLMHGMCDYDDINKYDCVKLFLMLYQLSHFFYKMRNGLLK